MISLLVRSTNILAQSNANLQVSTSSEENDKMWDKTSKDDGDHKNHTENIDKPTNNEDEQPEKPNSTIMLSNDDNFLMPNECKVKDDTVQTMLNQFNPGIKCKSIEENILGSINPQNEEEVRVHCQFPSVDCSNVILTCFGTKDDNKVPNIRKNAESVDYTELSQTFVRIETHLTELAIKCTLNSQHELKQTPIKPRQNIFSIRNIMNVTGMLHNCQSLISFVWGQILMVIFFYSIIYGLKLVTGFESWSLKSWIRAVTLSNPIM